MPSAEVGIARTVVASHAGKPHQNLLEDLTKRMTERTGINGRVGNVPIVG